MNAVARRVSACSQVWASLCAAVLVAFAVLLTAVPAWAKFTPPPLVGHVVDTSGKLGDDDVAYLNERLERVRLQSGYVLDVLVAGSLEGDDMSDVAYATFMAWRPGDAKKDNGVLLLIAPNERKVFIQTGKGVEGALTDLQSNDIIQTMKPRLQSGDLRGAIVIGTDAIARTLTSDDPGTRQRRVDNGGDESYGSKTFSFIGLIIFVIILLASRGRFFWWGGGGPWGGGSGGWGGGGGGGGFGGGFGGGGGSTGGGGAGDSY